MARSGVRDPLDKFRWTVSIDGFSRLGFASCSTPQYNINANTYAEGGNHLNPLSIVDSIEYVPVTLTRGVTNDTSFNKWATGFIDLITNNAFSKNVDSTFASDFIGGQIFQAASDNGADSVPSNNGTPFNYRRDIKLEHVNRAGQVEVIYKLYNAYPISYKPASDFEALSDDALSIETLTLAYEGFDVKYTGIQGLVGNVLADNLL